jgi:hypothetical protein
MINLSAYLEKFKLILTAPGAVKKPVISSILTHTGIELTEKELEIKESVIYLKTHPAVKGEVYMKKSLILKELQTLLGAKAPKDIR